VVGESQGRPVFPILVVLVLLSAFNHVARADEPVLRWRSVASAWDEFRLDTGHGAENQSMDDFLEEAGTAPRSGSVSLGTPFQLGLRRFERDTEGDLRGIDVSVVTRSERFKTCQQGADPQQDGFESTCRDFTLDGSRAVWIRFQNNRDPSHRGNLIKVEIDSENVLQIFSTQSGSQDLLAKFQKMFENFVSTLRIEGRAPPAKRSYHAEIRIPRNLRPGDVISPDVVVFDQDGNVAENIIQEVFFIDGREAGSIRWDGSRTRIEVQVSMKDGQAVTASGVIPAVSSPEPEPPRPEPTKVPAPVTVPEPQPEPQPEPGVTGEVPGLGGVGELPGPRTLGEAVVSILGPAAVGLLGALLGGMAGGGGEPAAPPQPGGPDAPPPVPPQKPPGRKRKPKKKKEPSPPPPHPPKGKKDPKKEDGKKKPPKPKKKKVGYWTRVLQRVKDGVKDVASGVAGAAKDIYKNPGLILQTYKNADAEVEATKRAAKDHLIAGAKYVGKSIVHVVKHPGKAIDAVKTTAAETYGAVKDVFQHPGKALNKVKKAGLLVKETVTGVAGAVWKSLKDAARDPDKLVDLVKTLVGIEDLEKSVEMDRSLASRIGHSLLGVLGIYGAAEGVVAVGRGASKVAARGGRGLLASLGDDAARIAAKAAQSSKGLADDAARAAARLGRKAGGNAADDVARVAARVGGETADDAARSAAKVGGKTDDLARSATSSEAAAVERKAARTSTKSPIRQGAEDFIDAPGVVPDTSGYTEHAQRHLQKIADKHDIQIYARPTTERAAKLIKNGEAIPKPMFVKNKTINQIDTLLGASADDIGKVGSFKPVRPSGRDLQRLSPEQAQKVMGRYHQRMAEFSDQASHLMENGDRCFVRKGVVHDRLTGKPYTGDIDVYGFRARNGKRLRPEKVQMISTELRLSRTESNVMHGVHEAWDKTHLIGREREIADGIDRVIRTGHQRGGEALVTFKPKDSIPSASWVAGPDSTIHLGA